MKFRVLGFPEVSTGERPARLGAGRPRLLLLMLLAAANRTVTDDRLTDGLWPDGPPPSARKNLQSYVLRLRRALDDPGRIARDAAGYRLTAAPAELDALRFEELVAAARAAADLHRRDALLSEALGLWRGAAYAGHADSAPLRDEALRLDELRLTVVEEHAETCLALGRHEALVPELSAFVRSQPLRERPAAQLMLALYHCGRRAEALEVYRETRARLADELGLDPSPTLHDAHRAVLSDAPTPTAPSARNHPPPRNAAPPRASPPPRNAAPPREAARASGSTPGRGSAPPRDSAWAEVSPWRGPRSPVGEVIGRDRECAELARLVRTRRLVTLTGPGGVGKTTVALRVAAREAPADGVVVLALAHLSRDDDVFAELAALLDVTGHGEAARRGVEERLRGGARLLVLDNCEHLAEPCARLAARLLPACPGLRILATGRRPLGVPGEVVRPLVPLPVPAADEVTDAVRLFARRAR
ncbi:helix-turn-helix domain-containing protein, partial [Actinomadura logoneensis]